MNAPVKTVLITGCSSGYGLATARKFHSEGWRVIATMRNPKQGLLPNDERVVLLPLDVTNPESIQAAVAAAGPIDVLVNNAGIGLAGAFEATPASTTREVFETNTFDMFAMAQAVIPQLRQRRSSAILNVTSSATLAPFPLVAVYTASKAAVDGFTRSLALELAEFGIRVKLIQPGYGPNTAFTSNGQARMEGLFPAEYAEFTQRVFGSLEGRGKTTEATDVADVVWQAANDTSPTISYPAGPDAVALAEAAAR